MPVVQASASTRDRERGLICGLGCCQRVRDRLRVKPGQGLVTANKKGVPKHAFLKRVCWPAAA